MPNFNERPDIAELRLERFREELNQLTVSLSNDQWMSQQLCLEHLAKFESEMRKTQKLLFICCVAIAISLFLTIAK